MRSVVTQPMNFGHSREARGPELWQMDLIAHHRQMALATRPLYCLVTRHLFCLATRHLSCLATRHLSCLATRPLSCLPTHTVEDLRLECSGGPVAGQSWSAQASTAARGERPAPASPDRLATR